MVVRVVTQSAILSAYCLVQSTVFKVEFSNRFCRCSKYSVLQSGSVGVFCSILKEVLVLSAIVQKYVSMVKEGSMVLW